MARTRTWVVPEYQVSFSADAGSPNTVRKSSRSWPTLGGGLLSTLEHNRGRMERCSGKSWAVQTSVPEWRNLTGDPDCTARTGPWTRPRDRVSSVVIGEGGGCKSNGLPGLSRMFGVWHRGIESVSLPRSSSMLAIRHRLPIR